MRRFVLCLAVVVGCKEPEATTSGFTTSTSPPSGLQWVACADQLLCADVQVPWDHADPSLGTATLTVWRWPANGDPEGVLFVNPGGPGASVGSFVMGVHGLLPELNDRFDVVAVDPRGAGDRPLGCFQEVIGVYDEDVAPITAEGVDARQDAALAWTDTCMETDGDWLPYVTLPDMADDLVFVADQMGWDTFGYYGVSGGSALGASLAEQHPDRVWAVAIDSVAPTVSYDELMALQLDGMIAVLDQWSTWCQGQELYVGTYGSYDCWIKADPVGALNEVLDQARTNPLSSTFGRPLTHTRAMFGVIGGFYSQWNWYGIADQIDQALNWGNADPLMAASDYALGYHPDYGFGDGLMAAYHTLLCATGSSTRTREELLADALAADAALPHFGPLYALDNSVCDGLPAPRRPYTGPVTAAGSPPILILQSSGDFATPLAGAQLANDAFENSAMVLWEGSTHGTAFASPCARGHLLAYLDGGVLPPDGTVCAD